jgi:putative ABC transport system permease protein
MQPLTELIIGKVRPIFLALLAAVATVLLIACVNVANLLLARGAVRAREVSVRFALGASRWRVVRMLLTESVVIAALGGAFGVLIAWWGVAALVGAIPTAVANGMPYLQNLSVDARVLAFTAMLVMMTGVLVGITPALQLASAKVFDALREGTRGFVVGHRVRNTLVIAEVGLALVMLVGASLLAKSLFRMLTVDPGFDPQNLLLVDTSIPGNKYQQPGQLEDVRRRMADRIRALPAVQDVASTTRQPLDGGFVTVRFQVEGEALASAGEQAEACTRTVSENYFSALGARLGEGRQFGAQDTLNSPPVVIVNRTLENKYFRDGKALGKKIRVTYAPDLPWTEIVGVIEDVNEASLDQPSKPALYSPASQDGNAFNTMVIRYQGDPTPLIGAVAGAVKEIDRDILAFNASTFDARISQSNATFLRRYPALLIGVFASVALLLSVIGVYGIIAFSVSQRTREIGVRMALGAQRGDVVRLILSEGARIGVIGIAAGIIAALITGRLVASMLFGVAPTDLPTFVAVPMMIGAIVIAAASVPAFRASRVDPMVALRYE